MNLLSIFITSNKVFLRFLLKNNFSYKELKLVYPFYPSFNTSSDLENLIKAIVKRNNFSINDFTILPLTTMHAMNLFGVETMYLSNSLKKFQDFLYIYFDNLQFFSSENASGMSFGLSKKSDNFISNRSIFPSQNFLGDLEEVLFFSTSIEEIFHSNSRKVILGGDYFSNHKIPYELKLNLISELLDKGFYEIYLDEQNEFPNYLNLIQNKPITEVLNISSPDYFHFFYYFNLKKSGKFFLNSISRKKSIDISKEETLFIHSPEVFKEEFYMSYTDSNNSQEKIEINPEFQGIFIDLRSNNLKKSKTGLENLRKVVDSIQKNNDYSTL